jgi:hypothetical protein
VLQPSRLLHMLLQLLLLLLHTMVRNKEPLAAEPVALWQYCRGTLMNHCRTTSMRTARG